MHWQGTLDGLCGVYSVVNSIHTMLGRKLDNDNYKEIFALLCEALDDQGRLRQVITAGMSVQALGKLIDKASVYLLEEKGLSLNRRLACREAPGSLDDFWNLLSEHHRVQGDGSIIIGLAGTYDHWTCIRKVTENSISLVDSDNLARLNRDRCTIRDPRGDRKHQLVATQTYLLSLS